MSTLLKVLFVVLLYVVWRYLVAVVRRGQRREPELKPTTGHMLVRDPVCNTYLPESRALTATSDGETLYFCSEECRQKHLKSKT